VGFFFFFCLGENGPLKNFFKGGLYGLLGFALIGDFFQCLFLVQVGNGDAIEEFVAADKAVDQVFVEMENVVPQFV